jgi:hypothetical protein
MTTVEVVHDRDLSPFERARDRQIETALMRDGRPLRLLAVIAEQHGPRWKIEILTRAEMLERLDTRGRDPSTEPEDRETVKIYAAWIRGLPSQQAPEIFVWECEDGSRSSQRGTIERER